MGREIIFSRLVIVVALLTFACVPLAQAEESSLVGHWKFDGSDAIALSARGDVTFDVAGPVPPEFPDFDETNAAVRLGGKGARLVFENGAANDAFAFGNGDAITAEAWVNVEALDSGTMVYIIGKGRTGSPDFARDNQNWALRIVGKQGMAYLGFLFATAPSSGKSQWHRWTSNDAFAPNSGWRHIAVQYKFGTPETIRGWIDGKPTKGTWDLGGPTTAAPVVDGDAVWIGSSQGGNPASSFRGIIDNVAVHRSVLPDDVMAKRFNRVGGPRIGDPLPAAMPEINDVPTGKVLVTFTESLATHARWPHMGELAGAPNVTWTGESFLLPRIPIRYDDWGIRADWDAPVMVRMAADVELSPGTYRFLVRTRALGRLWVDGELIAETKALTDRPPDGEEPVTPVAEPPMPGLRPHGYRMQEVFGDFKVPDSADVAAKRVVFETVAGGDGLRTETGETCVAVLTEDLQTYTVLRAADSDEDYLPLTDTAVKKELESIEATLSRLDDKRRRTAASRMEGYWKRRHEIAREWVASHPAPVPPRADDNTDVHPVDAFIEAKIAAAVAASSAANARGGSDFHGTVLPILREECFRCHGEKAKGGLRLNAREDLFAGGDSGLPAVVAGDPEASELMARITSEDDEVRMPPTGLGLGPDQIAALKAWIDDGAPWPAPPVDAEDVKRAERIDDYAFLRRVYLDTVGVPPTTEEIEAFFEDESTNRRERLIERLLADDRYADHWMGYWQDMLAENPTLINASLNSTGPFRWFLYDSFRDNKALDRMVTELIMLRGSQHEGGSAGFALAGENDAPFAAKGHIVASAFLAVDLECARCHDSPYHSTTQRDLFSLAAMFERKPVTVPEASTVPASFFDGLGRKPLIEVTLKPGEPVEPNWPFEDLSGTSGGPRLERLMRNPDDTRERLAAAITAPENERFARVVVNRVWKRMMGAGLVEPVHDWEGRDASHPDLLTWLAREFVANGYDLKHVMRAVLTSEAYQREATGGNVAASPRERFFTAPDKRRMTAEQVVDSLHAAAGADMDVEELTFVHDGRRPSSSRLTLGTPTRSWMFANLANERDRPSLSLPRAQAIADVLEAFGWTGARQKPITDRETEANVLQPGVLANGTMTTRLTRAYDGSELADLAVDAASPEALVDTLFLRMLCREPSGDERSVFTAALAEGFDERLLPAEEIEPPDPLPDLPLVTWFNHLQSEANTIQLKIEERVRQGPPADRRLRDSWRKIYEDVLWSLVNHSEFVWIP